MKAVAQRFSLDRMEIEPGDVELAQQHSLFQRVQPPERSLLQVRRHPSALAFAKQLLKPLVAEASYHRKKA